MAIPSTSRPAWQRHRLFRFFASLKLAVVLLAVLIIGAIAGGGKGALIGSAVGAGGSSLYTYKLNKKKRRYYRRP